MADGLFHTDDGRKFFADGKEASGVNNLVQKKSKHHQKKKQSHKHKSKKHTKHSHKGEPPAASIKSSASDDTKNMGEEEANSKEMAATHAAIAKQEKDKADAAKAAAKAKAE
jgi:histone acetyltransferase (RNA polymerase elongator complex component)